jgi:hypothetical protein
LDPQTSVRPQQIMTDTAGSNARSTKLTTEGHDIQREEIRRLSPLGHEHITLTGRYHIASSSQSAEANTDR